MSEKSVGILRIIEALWVCGLSVFVCVSVLKILWDSFKSKQ